MTQEPPPVNPNDREVPDPATEARRSDPSMGRPQGNDRLAIDRLVTFTDAVIAIAITLVALPLVDVARDVTSPQQFFHDSSYALIAAGISFTVIGTFWREHHHLFLRATDYPPLMLRVTLAWLACIMFLPVATVIEVRSTTGIRAALALYLCTILLTMILIRVEELMLTRAKLLADRKGKTLAVAELFTLWTPVALMTIVIAVALVFPHQIGLWSLLVLLAGRPLSWALAQRAPHRVRIGR